MTPRPPRPRRPRPACADVVLADGTQCRVRGVNIDKGLTPADLRALETFAAALRRLSAGETVDQVNASTDRGGPT
jgi:hypothetical protein